jgi:hypothetical protein
LRSGGRRAPQPSTPPPLSMGTPVALPPPANSPVFTLAAISELLKKTSGTGKHVISHVDVYVNKFFCGIISIFQGLSETYGPDCAAVGAAVGEAPVTEDLNAAREDLLHALQKFNASWVALAEQVTRLETMSEDARDQAVQAYVVAIRNSNPRHRGTKRGRDVVDCNGCCEPVTESVVIKRRCAGVCAGHSCQCPQIPACVSCFARQAVTTPHKSRCPTCRAQFCMKDVAVW